MNAVQTRQVAEILDRVKDWPPELKIILARRILESLEPAATPAPPRTGRSVRELIGMGTGDSPPPDDETVRRWIDEHRLEKSG
jgi:hypothetical protein